MKGLKLTHLAALLSAFAASAVAVTEPQAASRTCRQLEAELAAARGGGGGPGLVRKYDDAIARQREQLARARGRASDAGCGFTLFSRNVSQCAAINASIERMNANLDTLQAKRERLAAGGTRRDRSRILAALDANNCRDDEIAPQRAPLQEASRDNGGGNLFEQLFGRQDEQLETPDAPDMPDTADVPLDDPSVRNIRRVINQPDGMDLPRLGGEFRTMCVRTCDGYFYPMSNAASVGDFERDQKNCESSCPGTEMQVFYSRGMDDDSGSMTSSVTGQPYSSLPTAYLYKQANYSRPTCGCNAQAGNFTIIGGNPPNPEQSQPDGGMAPFIPMPAVKPDPGADPETLANAEGGLDQDAIKRLTTKVPVSPVSMLPPDQRKVRVVGPAFLPDPSAAIDLKAPAPKTAR
ncbi:MULTISPECIES: DUF2865 domain-containing protein [unclassified Mesorhizobium]|uniref:DUF2865 domain-containing protein n=3 Tax=Mesorhizobium TaxID=68287 RepID=UPI000F76037F|nr:MULTISPECIES: DUF2865 domain-containing protein [unclassified Mesorhizobium]AZO01730.1 DUF2865 domain-containing protein [Mesorhizobium sp. M2A.F.Ca.ET.043.02.1.1]RUW40239.1 DUF2865 domain-containing protein [Mesorhizobium sp. M2A.F.Ca.ET.015.02.1.1]RVD10476.1 DUF2865 domain-containing protein [Mesorhizobium sp. M2A.F.Ca.ET.029.05.1.1]RWB47679.1 MAG: DUF2865 domain-containing protein [Mesorhizobium sp.]RWB57306.1 MAG: DUF2865 domain-containing protein [Mesorhizobium sp.]